MTLPAPQRLIAIDLETTGLHPFFSEIVEIGAVAFDPVSGATLETFQTLVNPGIPIPPAVIAIHGIDDSMVADAPTLVEAFPKLVAFLGPGSIVVGHNVAFDLGFLRHRAAKLRQPLGCAFSIDTVRLAKWAYPGLASYRLGLLAAHLALPLDQAHRALDDALATTALFSRAFAQLESAAHSPEAIYGRVLKPIEEGMPSEGSVPDEMLHLYRACEDRLRLLITYANAQRETSRRVIDPLGMQLLAGSHYVVAYCHLKEANRNFRVDRIAEWEVVGEVPLEELKSVQGLLNEEGLLAIPEADADPPVEVFSTPAEVDLGQRL